jgi:hypothetical protein
MAIEWHYTLNGQQAPAPVSSAQLKQLAASGQLQPTDLVWQEGMTGWVPAGSVKGLFSPGKSLGDSAVIPPPSAGRPTRKPAPPYDWANMHPATVLLLTLLTAGLFGLLYSYNDWANMHPVAVLILALLTAGLFGLLYSYKICHAYSARATGRRADAAGRTLGKVRHPFGVLLLSYLTLGIYLYYWAYSVMRECNAYTGRKDINPRTELNLMLIFPPYTIYVVLFQVADMIRRAQVLAGQPETPAVRWAVLFLNPFLLVEVPILAMIYQDALNQIWLTVP